MSNIIKGEDINEFYQKKKNNYWEGSILYCHLASVVYISFAYRGRTRL